MKIKVIAPLLLFVIFMIVWACKHEPEDLAGPQPPGPDPGPDPPIGNPCDPDTVYFEKDLLPVLLSTCAQPGCHDAITMADGVRLTDYNSVMQTAGVEPGAACRCPEPHMTPTSARSRMFIAMNRFQIAVGHESAFETLWRERESHLDGVPGFREFRLLKGPADDRSTLYASHSLWDSRQAFEAWTESDAFRQAHAKARAPEGTYLGPPQFEGFDVVLEL